ncbi:DNA topology modulation protein [Ornithinibacillus scapharcae]|uniref:DNA topology modulation protein n=1 Tax=Ornithinibacillus scapharcae TaxID=1147159 RepID=UPI000225AFA4|nr:DNA topology modulation protein [Ornithinibacillus scapharcae]
MNKIMLIGSGGAGKSTLAKEIGQKLNIPVYHLDSFLWKANWEAVTRENQIKIQNDLIQEKEWIIDGNYGGTMDIRLKAADTIIYLDVNRIICVYRAFKRMLKYRNKQRPDMAVGCEEKIDFGFLKWIWNYPKTKRPETINKLNQLKNDKTIIILHSPKEIKQFIGKMS